MSPIQLTDTQMFAVLAAAHPLPPHCRSAFLESCARELAGFANARRWGGASRNHGCAADLFRPAGRL
jgi:hypothetical protein